MSLHSRLLAALILACAPTGDGSRIAAMWRKGCKHRSQRVPRNQVVLGNLYGVPLPTAYLRPGLVQKLRESKGSQAVHRARRNAERAT